MHHPQLLPRLLRQALFLPVVGLTLIAAAGSPSVRAAGPGEEAAESRIERPSRPTRPDREPPIVLALPADPARVDGVLKLNAQVMDDTGVGSVVLWAKGEGDEEYQRFSMSPVREIENRFTARLSPWASRGQQVAYYVEAVDSLGNGPARAGTARRPFVVPLTPAPRLEEEPEGSLAWAALLLPAALAIPLYLWLRKRKKPGNPSAEQAFWFNELLPLLDKRGSALSLGLNELCSRTLQHPVRGPIRPTRVEALTWLNRLRALDRADQSAPGARPASRASTSRSKDAAPLVRPAWHGARTRKRASAAGTSPRIPEADSQAGMTMAEVVVAMGIVAMLVGVGSLYLRPMESPIQTGTHMMDGFLRQVRARAMATTSAHRVVPTSPSRLKVEHAGTCLDTAWTLDSRLRLELPRDVTMTDTAWSLCFSSRGIASSNLVMTLDHPLKDPRSMEVLRGGAMRSVP